MQPHPLDKIFKAQSTTSPVATSSVSAHPLDKIFAPTKRVAPVATSSIPTEPFPEIEEGKGKGKGFFAGIVDPLSKFGGSVLKTLLPASLEGQQLQQGQVTGLTGNTIDVAGFKQGQELTGTEYAKDVVGTTAQALSYLPIGGAVSTLGKAVAKRTMPALARTALEGGLGTGLAFGGQALQEQKSLAESGVEAVKGFGIGAVAAPVIGVGLGALGVGARKLFTTKTEQEILSTPIENLGKLSTTERNYYFSKKSEEIAKKYDDEITKLSDLKTKETSSINKAYQETTAKVASEQAAKIDIVKTQAEQLNRQLADASIAEAENLKPKLIDAMRKNSDTYRKLVDDEISSVADVQVTRQELNSSIRNMFENEPKKAEQIISILDNNVDGPQSVKSIYERTKSLRKEIGAGAKQGNRTLTSEEYNTTEAISQLLDFLKIEKGVDLSRANKFWAEYSPIKNKLYRYIQPYKPTGSETASFKTFAKILTSNDPYNQNFIKETEKLLGVNFKDSKVRDILSKIDENKKRQIAAKITSETKLKEAQIQKLEQTISAKEKLATLKQSAKEMKSLEEAKQELVKLRATQEFEKRTLLKRIIGGFLVIAIGQQATNAVLGGF